MDDQTKQQLRVAQDAIQEIRPGALVVVLATLNRAWRGLQVLVGGHVWLTFPCSHPSELPGLIPELIKQFRARNELQAMADKEAELRCKHMRQLQELHESLELIVMEQHRTPREVDGCFWNHTLPQEVEDSWSRPPPNRWIDVE